ncbi:hypothetical protein [Nocardioides daphniae]|uniref:hypothetical protein n=1 Tax=Nocardioides daphniae TaxID=402297 RepID=UPI001930F971|nr:hypothetical protein [Nocardioides daphniae]
MHVAGNSLGGWMGIELARRGRARSVCALSPAGFWMPGGRDQTGSARRLRFVRQLTRASAPVTSTVMRSALVRRLSMRDIAVRGDRLTPEAATVAATDLLRCTAGLDILSTTESIAPLDPTPCPITWCGPSTTASSRSGSTVRQHAASCRALGTWCCPAPATSR